MCKELGGDRFSEVADFFALIPTVLGNKETALRHFPPMRIRMTKYLVLAAILFSATACCLGDTWGQRAVTSGAIGAGGALVGVATGHPLLERTGGRHWRRSRPRCGDNARSPLLKLYSDRLREAAYQGHSRSRAGTFAGMEVTGVPGLLFWLVKQGFEFLPQIACTAVLLRGVEGVHRRAIVFEEGVDEFPPVCPQKLKT